MAKIRLGVLASTRGTDMQTIIDEIEAGRLEAEISVVISNKKDAYALERARKHGIEAVFVDAKDKSREEFDKEVMGILKEKNVELILLIGYMRILSSEFVNEYENRIMNVHPSLLPAFGGGMDKDVHQAILDYGVKVTGCTIHFVDESVDEGPIVVQRVIQIAEDETVDSLKDKVQDAEKKAFIDAIKLFAAGRLKVEGRRVRILENEN
ncbi:MAG: phosphoribosylglycinamide formyltransferase [Candidatus Altiarchaeales archaeon]|nr:phosphoribosylglycinamide formyltransferase [Candidatus Altiarchaeota archaeon]MBU4342358.1 phosphoribosylglycinamide formyltransferase [Candidatus Altiarchaeota archaeon]MBU4406537.1 phosphoribosylglycinamide formyltransferase [Candidatus Altiarchaeota archaeon]MBU4437224.1 phosphoribosylglycinamide formyltransferase [Candidatus Altiarchaeota archaeon]MCG2782328.1 phosphoribosylglycinamide formyltransferase [Candidatus Altiarchaeales archaeon]